MWEVRCSLLCLRVTEFGLSDSGHNPQSCSNLCQLQPVAVLARDLMKHHDIHYTSYHTWHSPLHREEWYWWLRASCISFVPTEDSPVILCTPSVEQCSQDGGQGSSSWFPYQHMYLWHSFTMNFFASSASQRFTENDHKKAWTCQATSFKFTHTFVDFFPPTLPHLIAIQDEKSHWKTEAKISVQMWASEESLRQSLQVLLCFPTIF